jgi:hypothetical protein
MSTFIVTVKVEKTFLVNADTKAEAVNLGLGLGINFQDTCASQTVKSAKAEKLSLKAKIAEPIITLEKN